MRFKIMAMCMLLGIVSAGSPFAEQVNAKNTVEAHRKTMQTVQLTSSGSLIPTNICCRRAVVHFQNFTPWNVQCYVNGVFVGVVYPGRTLSSYAPSGWVRPNAQAVFVDGSSLSWDLGNVFYSPGGNYLFPMHP